MRRFALVAFVLVVTLVPPGISEAQGSSWEPRLVLPGGHISDVVFADRATVWAVGDGGVFLSEDGGRSWRNAYIDGRALTAVDAAPDGMHGWAVGPLGHVVATADGGKTWEAQQSGTQVNLMHVAAVDADSAIAGGWGVGFSDVVLRPEPFVVLRTDDGGARWRVAPLPGGYQIRSVDMLPDGLHGWIAAGRCGELPPGQTGCPPESAVLTTGDGGLSWRVVSTGTSLTAIQAASKDVAWGSGLECEAQECRGYLLRSGDGGETWELAYDAERAPVLGFAVLSPVAAVVAREDCQQTECVSSLLETTDGGQSWNVAAGPGLGRPGALLAFWDRRHGVWGRLWTSDGMQWLEGDFPVSAASGDFDFVDAATGWVAASSLLRTVDGGQTWQVVSGQRFDRVDFVSPSSGWALETRCQPDCQGVVWRSDDGGATWVQQSSVSLPFGYPPFEMAFFDSLHGVISSEHYAGFWRTADGGMTWQFVQLPVPPDTNVALAFGGPEVVWAAAQGCPAGADQCAAVAYVSTDGGVSWQQRDLAANQCWRLRLGAFDSKRAWAATTSCGEREAVEVHRTVDGGMSWTHIELDGFAWIGRFEFLGPAVGRVIGIKCRGEFDDRVCEGVLLVTSDGGASWTEESAGQASGLHQFDYQFLSPERGWRMETESYGLVGNITRQTLYSYTGGPGPAVGPIYGPDVGTGASGGRNSAAPAVAFLALAACALAVVLARLGLRRSG